MSISIEKRTKLEELVKGLKISLHFDEIVLNSPRRSSIVITAQDLEDNELCDIASNFKAGLSKGNVVRDEEKWSVIKWNR